MKRICTHSFFYTIWLKRGGPAIVQAVGYTERKREGRIYFHLDGNSKDREVFFKTTEIAGITLEGKPAVPGAGRNEFEEWWKKTIPKVSSPKGEGN